MKKLLVIVILLAIGIFVGYRYMYQPHRDIAEETAAFQIEASKFQGEFATDQKVAETKYLNQTILVEGVISEKEAKAITIADAVYVSFTSNEEISLAEGDQVKVKGRCIGYDELLELVKLDQSTILNE